MGNRRMGEKSGTALQRSAGATPLSLLVVNRRRFAMFIYAAIVAFSYASAFLLRFEFSIPPDFVSLLAITIAPLVLIRLAVYRTLGLTRERWRYTSTGDVLRLGVGTAVGSMVFFLLIEVFAPTTYRIPLSVVALEPLLTCFTTAAVWVLYRALVEHSVRRASNTPTRRALVIGAGEAGNMLVREMVRFPTGYRPVGFVDDNPAMWGASIHGLTVFGPTSDLVSIAERLNAEEIIIAVPSADPAMLRIIVQRCEATQLPFKVLPGIKEVLAGKVRMDQIRDVRIEDLLGREPIQLELPELAEDLRNESVLITGAAGSIGSELSRQVALHQPQRLVLLDQAETELFYLELELREKHPGLNLIPIVADIVDAGAMEEVFSCFSPSRVFHAAAYKHVPMMEVNVREAVQNNVVGTRRVAEAAGRFGVKKFVLVSTDKAVRPANVMGATKRLAELTVLELQSRYPGTVFGAVRFGNVLGSNGSVIPIFKRQIREGKPLTVTDPDTTRYFMTIPEAVQLILQASLLPELRGHIAMLDMGEPVRIADLATNLLRLSGADQSRIVFTGLRPGEKLHEELSAPEETALETPLKKVQILKTTAERLGTVNALIESWEKLLRTQGHERVVSDFLELFPQIHRITAKHADRPAHAKSTAVV